MESADPRKTAHTGHETHGVLLCLRCRWPFPNAHPSARHRRAHKRICGTIEGYTVMADSVATLSHSHSHSQHSTVSSFSDDEHGSDGDSKALSAKVVISRTINEGGSGHVLERVNTSADDVFADAVSEFADANASLAGDESLESTTDIISNNTAGVPSFYPPVEDGAVTGIVQASVNHENSKSSSPQEGSTRSPDLEKVMIFSEIPAKFETMTDAREEKKRTYAFEDPAGVETDFTKVDDTSEVNAAPVIVPMIGDASKTGVAVTEVKKIIALSLVESEICWNEEKHDVKSGSETFVDDQSQESKNLLHSSDEISEVKAEDITHIKCDELVTELATGGSASTSPRVSENDKIVAVPSVQRNDNSVLVTNEVANSGCEIKGEISCSLSVDGIGAPPTTAGIETVGLSSAHVVSGHDYEDSNKKYPDSLTRASANGDTGAISATDKSGQVASIGGNDIIDPEDGFENRGIIAEDFVAEAGREVPENDMNLDNPSIDIGSEAHASMLPVVCVTGTHENTDTEVFVDIGTGNAERFVPKDLSPNINVSLVQSIRTTSGAAHKQLDRMVESLDTDSAVLLSSDVNSSLGDDSIGNNIGNCKEVKLDLAEASDPVIDPKPVSHDVLLQKLEEDLSDDEPVETSLATESSSQSLGNNGVDGGGVFCKDASSKDFGQSQECDADPEKGTTISVADAPYEISSPNGSSLDGNWGSISVLSTMSDATADVKKTKDAQEEQSHKKCDIFDPPSFPTLIEPEAQKAAAAASKSGEVQSPQQPDAAKAAWFPSITNAANDSHGRKKNEEIIAKVTNWSAGKQQHSPLKTLLGEANSLNLNPPAAPKDNSTVKNSTQVTTVNSILGSEESELPKDKFDSSTKEWSSPARYPDEIKREKRKAKGKPYWVPFMCCSSVK